jgi:hypothetical protein
VSVCVCASILLTHCATLHFTELHYITTAPHHRDSKRKQKSEAGRLRRQMADANRQKAKSAQGNKIISDNPYAQLQEAQKVGAVQCSVVCASVCACGCSATCIYVCAVECGSESFMHVCVNIYVYTHSYAQSPPAPASADNPGGVEGKSALETNNAFQLQALEEELAVEADHRYVCVCVCVWLGVVV